MSNRITKPVGRLTPVRSSRPVGNLTPVQGGYGNGVGPDEMRKLLVPKLKVGGIELVNPNDMRTLIRMKEEEKARIGEEIEGEQYNKLRANVQTLDPNRDRPGTLKSIDATGAAQTSSMPVSYSAEKFLKLSDYDVDLANKLADLNKKVSSDDQAKQGIRSITLMLPKLLEQMEKIGTSDVRPFGPSVAKVTNYLKSKADLLPEYDVLGSSVENIQTPMARALGDTRVSDADAKRSTSLLTQSIYSGDVKAREMAMDNFLTLLEGQGGVDIRGFLERKQDQIKRQNILTQDGKNDDAQKISNQIQQDQEAVEWALDNPGDPRAVMILDKLGISITSKGAVPFKNESASQDQ